MNTGAGFRQQPDECGSAEPGTRNYLLRRAQTVW